MWELLTKKPKNAAASLKSVNSYQLSVIEIYRGGFKTALNAYTTM